MSAVALQADSAGQYNGSAKGFCGVQRKVREDRSMGQLYEQTPQLYDLPPVGAEVYLTEREVDTFQRERFYPVGYGVTKYTVRYYTQGIENPLKSNNFMGLSYQTKSGHVLSKSVRTLDIALGIIRCSEPTNEED